MCPVGVVKGLEEYLTYHSESPVEIGAIVVVPFGNKQVVGVVMKECQKPAFATKMILEVVGPKLSTELLGLALWMNSYYATHLSTILQTILPTGSNKRRRTAKTSTLAVKQEKETSKLTRDQADAVQKIKKSNSITTLLHGVTGSGKTRIYQELATEALNKNRSVLILVPEIALTPQLAANFNHLHDKVFILHSNLSEAQRHILWNALEAEKGASVVIGPRSALFSPLKNIGLIVVDECHEPSYQQDSQPKYSALRVARKLAEIHKAKLILGSATPLISDYYVAKLTNTPIVKLPKAVNESDVTIDLVDMRDREMFGNNTIFSKKLLASIERTLTSNKQSLLFHNRRGTARTSLCSHCGWVAECPNCHIPLRLHHDIHRLLCHTCNFKQPVPQVCPNCKNSNIDFRGFGSKRIEQEIRKLFPGASVARFDSDTPKSEQLQNRYQDLYSGSIDIIIGTQGLAKGLDLPHLDTVGIVQADSELFIPDFSSTERSFQLTTQVIGRVGRQGQKAEVIIQTFNPEHPAIKLAMAQDYSSFYKLELTERKLAHVTPFVFMLQLVVGYASAQNAEAAALKMKRDIQTQQRHVFIRGPGPAFRAQHGRMFYQQLVVTSHDRKNLVEIAKNLPNRWQFTLDPLNLL